jgi:8-oxo-dGTP diphosphatase
MENLETLSEQLTAKAKIDKIDALGVGAVILGSGKVLILRRKADDTFPGIYEIPGGGVDEGETLPDALKREVYEETGLRLKSIDRYISSFDYNTGKGRKREFDFVVSVEIGDISLTEHDDYKWAARDELSKYKITPEMKKQIEKAFQ